MLIRLILASDERLALGNSVGAGFIPARAMALAGGDKPRPYSQYVTRW
jgi:hypothetical protein